MGKDKAKPRKKLDPKSLDVNAGPRPKKEKDWSFDDIARSKTKRH